MSRYQRTIIACAELISQIINYYLMAMDYLLFNWTEFLSDETIFAFLYHFIQGSQSPWNQQNSYAFPICVHTQIHWCIHTHIYAHMYCCTFSDIGKAWKLHFLLASRIMHMLAQSSKYRQILKQKLY